MLDVLRSPFLTGLMVKEDMQRPGLYAIHVHT